MLMNIIGDYSLIVACILKCRWGSNGRILFINKCYLWIIITFKSKYQSWLVELHWQKHNI